MPHLDEGTLHALLDGELDVAEVKEIQTHLGACAACGSRLQDVKQFLAEADSLVGALETPAGAPRPGRAPAPPPEARPQGPDAGPWREPVWDAPPQLLLPENPEEVARRRRWHRRFRWAAMVALVLGAGQLVKSVFGPGEPKLLMNERDVISSAPQEPLPVTSPEETIRPGPAAPPPRPSTATRPAAPKAVADQRPTPAKQVAETVAANQFDTLSVAQDDTSPPPAAEIAAASQADPPQDDTEPAARGDASADAATRAAAAAALAELDRERLRSRANDATASLPRAEAPPAEPAPRTLEQKAQTYLRIGLDEAAQQLGRPMHVIEAMSPEFVGLTQGRLVAGADPNRPVVRVVYRDQRGRMILLDQQRLRTGQAPGGASGSLRWTLGDVMLYLHGEPGNDVLRNLQRRVR